MKATMPHPVYEIDTERPLNVEEMKLSREANKSGVAVMRLFMLRVQNKFTKRPITPSQLNELTVREYESLIEDLAQGIRDMFARLRAERAFAEYEPPEKGRVN
jgi:hypothetical protein